MKVGVGGWLLSVSAILVSRRLRSGAQPPQTTPSKGGLIGFDANFQRAAESRHAIRIHARTARMHSRDHTARWHLRAVGPVISDERLRHLRPNLNRPFLSKRSTTCRPGPGRSTERINFQTSQQAAWMKPPRSFRCWRLRIIAVWIGPESVSSMC